MTESKNWRHDGRVEEAQRVRAFTRTWTAVNDVLDESYLGTPYGVAEARILYELAQRRTTPLVDLRTRLRLDAFPADHDSDSRLGLSPCQRSSLRTTMPDCIPLTVAQSPKSPGDRRRSTCA